MTDDVVFRLFSDITLAAPCRNCEKPRREHKGRRYDGACPGAKWGDAMRFRTSHVPRRRSGWPSRLPGGGPWLILQDCPARLHNSQRAAEARDGARCVCPRAVVIWEGRNVTRKERKKAKNRALLLPHQTEIRMPDLTSAACRTPWGRKRHEKGFSDQVSVPAETERREAKKVCRNECPVMKECAAYVLAAESPAGSWGGIWGGLDPWNRVGKQVSIANGAAEVRPYVAP